MIQSLMTETITVLRPKKEGAYVKGRYVDSPCDELTFRASVQPYTGEKLDNVPELERTRETLIVYLVEELFTAQRSPLKKPDVLVYNSRKYEVTAVERWPSLIPHHRVTVEQLDDSEEP